MGSLTEGWRERWLPTGRVQFVNHSTSVSNLPDQLLLSRDHENVPSSVAVTITSTGDYPASARNTHDVQPRHRRLRGNREEAHDEHPVVGPSGSRRAHISSAGRHQGFMFDKVSEQAPSFGALPRGKSGWPSEYSNSSARSD